MRHRGQRSRSRGERTRPRWLAAGESGTSIVGDCRDELALIVNRRRSTPPA